MGEYQGSLFSPEFNRSIHVEARPERLSSEAGALVMRELMDRLGYSSCIRKHLKDRRDGDRVTHPFAELVRTAVLMLAQGWSDHDDVTRLRHDPVVRLAVSNRRGQRPLRSARKREPEGLCSQPTLSRLLACLSREENRIGLGSVLLESAERRMGLRDGVRLAEITLDLDSLPQAVCGHQPGSERNGYYPGIRCYHPLILRSAYGDYLAAKLRPGNVHSGHGGDEFVLPVLRRVAPHAQRVWLRIDAGFPSPRLLSRLEAEEFRYVARLKSTAPLERMAEPHLASAAREPLVEGGTRTYELQYQAKSWPAPRRVVLAVIERSQEQGQLFLDHFFLLTNATSEEMDGTRLIQYYRERALAEKDFGDWNQAMDVSLSSSPRPKRHYRGQPIMGGYTKPDSFGANEARMLLSLIAANLLHAGAALLQGEVTARMSRDRFRQLILKSAARVLLGGHRIRIVVEAKRAALWNRLMSAMNQLYPARGSPAVLALPTPA